jgi:carbamate kinase
MKEGTRFQGVEAVIDKDLASAKLGEQVNADILIIATDVEKVALNYGREYMKQGHFPPGSMGPKIQAVINFLESGGEQAIITSIEKIKEALEGKTGTHFFVKDN